MKKLLVTGSSGFIGRALKKQLLKQNYRVYDFNLENGDIADKNALRQFDTHGIDHVIHLAGRVFVPDSWDDPHQFYSTNVTGTLNVLEFCKLNQCTLTYVSAYLYGLPNKLPISENTLLQPNNPYAHSKYLAEELCRFYHKTFNTKIVVIRPFNVFGVGQNKIFLIPSIIHQVLYDKEIIVNDLVPRRDYIYMEDLIKSLTASLSCKKDFGIYNIGSGYSLSVKEIIDKIQIVFNSSKNVVSRNEERKSEISDVVANITRAKNELGWEPENSFEQGLEYILKAITKDIS